MKVKGEVFVPSATQWNKSVEAQRRLVGKPPSPVISNWNVWLVLS